MFLKAAWPKLRRLELALLIGFSVTLLLGLWLEHEQSELVNDVLRLHVLANSDSIEDQTLKLKVRDRILEEAELILPDNSSVDQAAKILKNNLEKLAAAGAQVVAEEGYGYPVLAEVCETWFPTKQYEDFSMPAGQYQALRIVIGEGEGQNWWCVVFPPLCLSSASESLQETALKAGMSEQQVAMLTGETEGYVIKFKAIELWEQLKNMLN